MKEIPHPIQEVAGRKPKFPPAQEYKLQYYTDLIERAGAHNYHELWEILSKQDIRKRNERLRLVK